MLRLVALVHEVTSGTESALLMDTRTIWRAVTAVLLLAFGAQASFDFTVSTYPANTGSPGLYINLAQDAYTSPRGAAAPFVVTDNLVGPSDETFQVENVMIPLLYAGDIYNPDGPEDIINLYIASNSGGVPGAVVGTVVTAGAGTDWDGSAFINLASPIDVTEGQTYWLVAEAEFDQTHNNQDNLFVWFPSATDTGFHSYQTGDSSWTFSWTSSSALPANLPAFGINVPEPATAGLLALAGVAAFAGYRRRRVA